MVMKTSRVAKKSAGIVAYKIEEEDLQVLLVHPGGPFWKNKDAGAWSIPKGEIEEGEDPLEVALREFEEETGNKIEAKNFIRLTDVKQKSGKNIQCWAVAADFDKCFIKSNTFTIEWPPKSGSFQSFPEVDNAGWFSVKEASKKLNEVQFTLIKELQEILGPWLNDQKLNSKSKN